MAREDAYVKYRRDETEHQTLVVTKALNPVFGEM